MKQHLDGAQIGVARRSRLVRYLSFAYVVLVVYASLYPFRPWRELAASPFTFLWEPWPRHYTATDVALNVMGYLPLGFLIALSALSRTVADDAPLGRAHRSVDWHRVEHRHGNAAKLSSSARPV
jgi:hypothetical protein